MEETSNTYKEGYTLVVKYELIYAEGSAQAGNDFVRGDVTCIEHIEFQIHGYTIPELHSAFKAIDDIQEIYLVQMNEMD